MFPMHLSRRFIHCSSKNLKDYYKILGIAKNAAESDIKKAYYSLAKKYHPDVNKDKGAGEKFQELSEAYEVLSDAKKRRDYDQFGSAGASSFGAGGGGGGGSAGSRQWQYTTHRSPEDLFRDLFGDFDPFKGNRGAYAESAFGFDAAQQVNVKISFEEAARGCNKTLNVNVVDDCWKCQGNGVSPGYTKVSCPFCNGTGVTSQHVQGFFMQQTCNRCGGSGSFNKNPCMECEGHGRAVTRKTCDISIPAGVDDNQVLRTQLGKSVIYVLVNNIFTDVEISVAQALLGGTIKVPGILQDTIVRIPPGTSSHTQMCLKGKGIKRLNQAGYGDQYINIKIYVPKKLGEIEKRIALEWAKIEKNTPGTVEGKTETEAKTTENPKQGTEKTTSSGNDNKEGGDDNGGAGFIKKKLSKFF
ncbi:dnaJ domain-containing protein [Ditylenchus destructor]|uniref:DnaJ domain-containing protein n=1 Tax=Ditylenchus destructor TaxID=166010 RepID=A0AAD4N0B7_9BILA|nr:dnaJ domain-containing protein [Ditylenchus destructor]